MQKQMYLFNRELLHFAKKRYLYTSVNNLFEYKIQVQKPKNNNL
jgi:hypothetical protein